MTKATQRSIWAIILGVLSFIPVIGGLISFICIFVIFKSLHYVREEGKSLWPMRIAVLLSTFAFGMQSYLMGCTSFIGPSSCQYGYLPPTFLETFYLSAGISLILLLVMQFSPEKTTKKTTKILITIMTLLFLIAVVTTWLEVSYLP